jgi:hypothetical protein
MSKKISGKILAMAAALMLAFAEGCGNDLAQASAPGEGARPLLRYRVDQVRGFAWALRPDGVDVYGPKGALIGHVVLPEWSWAGHPYGCVPDLVIGPDGAALISSDVQPTLWRVRPETLEVSRHDLVLDPDEGRDIGFSRLAYSTQEGAFLAVGSFHGARWRIGSSLKTAQKMLPVRGSSKCSP